MNKAEVRLQDMKLTDYRPFGRTGVKVSPLTLGCMMFGGKTGLDDSCRIIDRAIDAGVNVLDTANAYSRGRSEEFTGEALKRNGRRSRIFLCTKVHMRMDDTDPNQQGNSRRHIIEQCEASLRRPSDRLHRPLPDRPSAAGHRRSTKRCARSTISFARARSATSARRPLPPGRWLSRCGPARSSALTASFPSSRLTTCSTAASNASSCPPRKPSARDHPVESHRRRPPFRQIPARRTDPGRCPLRQPEPDPGATFHRGGLRCGGAPGGDWRGTKG